MSGTNLTGATRYLTVPELAALLRIKERKVYDLAATGAVPVSRVTGKLLFPEAEVRAWISGRSDGPVPVARPEIFLGSHDPLLEWALRQSGCGLPTLFEGSHDGLSRFAAGEGIATGLHIHEGDENWNAGAVAAVCAGQNAVLVAFARRRRGIVTRHGSGIATLQDLRGRRVVPRQGGSGARALFDALLAEAGIAAGEIDFIESAPTESDAVLAVAQGGADATLGLEALARQHGLDHVPLIDESFDILVDRAAWFAPPLQAFWRFCASGSFRAHAAGLAGYTVDNAGQVRWNA